MFSPEQYSTLRRAAGLLDRSSRGRLRLTGEDRRTYLQGLLTNDIAALSAGRGCYACLLTPQGRMIADMRVLDDGEALWLDLSGDVTARVREHLDQFVFSEDVQVADLTASVAEVGVYGPLAAEVVAGALGSLGRAAANLPPTADLQNMRPYANIGWRIGVGPVLVVRSDDIGIDGFDLFVNAEHASDVQQAVRALGAVDVSDATADVCRVEAGRPLFHKDMDESTIPLEAGIEDRAISLTKGCYVGQEIIIRVLHRGHGRVARRLSGLSFEPSAPIPIHGAKIRAADREIGTVTSAVHSPALERPIALGYVHRDFAAPGTEVEVLSGDRVLPAVVVTLPFVGQSAAVT
jgi:folate-binding protein YgfZ